jgi:hypothetical protein
MNYKGITPRKVHALTTIDDDDDHRLYTRCGVEVTEVITVTGDAGIVTCANCLASLRTYYKARAR